MATSGSFGQYIQNGSTWTISWERLSYNVPNKTSTIRVKIETLVAGLHGASYSIKVNGTDYNNNYTNNTQSPAVFLDNIDFTISHNSEGKNASFTIYFNVPWPASDLNQTVWVDDIPVPATISNADNFNDEENPTITYNNPSGNLVDSLLVGIRATDGSMIVSYREVAKTSTSYTFNLSETERNALRREIRTGATITVRFYLRTRIGGTNYDNYVSRTLTLINYEPTLNPTIPIDTNSATVALTGNDSILVRSYSNVYVETGAEARKGATIASQYIMNGSTTVNEGSATFNGIESNTFYYSVTDSRDFTTRDAFVVDLVPYFKPTISLSVLPFSLAGDLTFTLKGKYFNSSFGAKDNSFSVYYAIVESSQSLSTATYQHIPSSASTIVGDDYSTNYTINGLDPNKSYQLMVKIQDSLDSSYASRQSIAASPLFDWSRTDFNFNVPVYLKDTSIPLEGLKDYVTLQGTNGDWFYRLWYSGKVELFGMKDISYEACKTDFGGWYRTAEQSSPAYPFTINNAIVTANYESDGYGAIIWPITRSTTSKPFDFYLIRPTEALGIVGKVTFHVIGDLEGGIA